MNTRVPMAAQAQAQAFITFITRAACAGGIAGPAHGVQRVTAGGRTQPVRLR